MNEGIKWREMSISWIKLQPEGKKNEMKNETNLNQLITIYAVSKTAKTIILVRNRFKLVTCS